MWPAFALHDERTDVERRARAEVVRRLQGWVDAGRVAGLQYLVLREDRPWIEHVAGLADAATARAVGRDTVFNLYSLTKPLTAALVAALARRGALDLDAPIATATARADLAHLGSVRETLLHRAGFANPMPLGWWHRAEDDHGFDEPAFVRRQLDRAARRRRLGARYSNLGYLALGAAVERATGLRYREAAARHVLAPLQLQAGERLEFGTAARDAAWSAGHLRRHGLLGWTLGAFVDRRTLVDGQSGPWLRLHPHHVDGSAYGGLVGNARGLAAFGAALLGQRAGFDAPLRDALCAPVPGPGPARTLGWLHGRVRGAVNGAPWLGHAGGGLGAYGEMRLYPTLDAVSVLLTNRPGLRDARALDGLDARWIDTLHRGGGRLRR